MNRTGLEAGLRGGLVSSFISAVDVRERAKMGAEGWLLLMHKVRPNSEFKLPLPSLMEWVQLFG